MDSTFVVVDTESYYYIAQCTKCRVKFRIYKLNVLRTNEANIFNIKSEFRCKCDCNYVHDKLTYNPESISKYSRDSGKEVCCNQCGSTQVTSKKMGVGVGLSVIGGLLFGPLGTLIGVVGKDAIVVTCLKCGNEWHPGKN